jgi:hypothetical protein
MKKIFGPASALGLLLAASALAQSVPPQVQSIGPNDLFQDVVGGFPTAQSQYANASLLGNFPFTQASAVSDNVLIGGDFTTNLFQDGTTVGSITTTATYVADQWSAWSGTSTTLAGTAQTGAADIPAAYGASLRLTRSGAGVVQSCVAQEVLTNNSLRFQGQTAEFDFHALAGAGFSAAGSNLQVSIVTGTGTDEGISKLAFAFNGGGGGSSTWTGQANAANNLLVPITAGWGRYTVVAPIPATATEIAAIICWKPVGASPSNDYFEFTGAQLVVNPSLTTLAGTAGAVLVNDTRAKSFARRAQGLETMLQQGYYARLNETNGVVIGLCQATGATAGTCSILLPVPMRIATPIVTIPTTGTFSVNIAGTPTTWVTPTAGTCGPLSCTITIGNTNTAGQMETLSGAAGATGVVKINSRF